MSHTKHNNLNDIETSAIDKRYHCNGPDCTAIFSHKRELEQHRDEPSIRHEWCDICEVWSKDWNAFVAHKAQSSNHLSCPDCGQDFHSIAGMNSHIKQRHPKNKKINCMGCSGVFPNHASIIAHLEKGRCRGNTVDQYEAGVARKDIIRRVITEQERYKPIERENAFAPTAESSTSSIADPSSTTSVLESGPTRITGILPLQPTKKSVQLCPPREGKLIDLDDPAWPDPDRPVHFPIGIKSAAFPLNEEDEILPEPTKPSPKGAAGSWSLENSVSKLFPDARQKSTTWESSSTTSPSSVSSWSTNTKSTDSGTKSESQETNSNDDSSQYRPFSYADARGNVHTRNLFTEKLFNPSWLPDSPDFNAEDYFNHIIQKYECPFKQCTETFHAPIELSDHLTWAHVPSEPRCPNCQRRFKTYAGTMAHAESGKCRIRDGGAIYNRLVDEYSGGLVPVEVKEIKVRHPQWS